MEIKNFISSVLYENIYVVINKNECIIIDPGKMDNDDVIEYIKEKNLDLKYILLTHGHFDHIMGLEKILSYKKVPVYMGKEDIEFLYDSKYSLSYWINIDYKLNKVYDIREIEDGKYIFDLKCIKTPGHTKGSVCYLDEEGKVLFTGDTLFKNAYGRTDFPTGNYEELNISLQKIFELNSEIKILPGHGSSTTIKNEKTTYYNMFY